jgi:hypothetical protein
MGDAVPQVHQGGQELIHEHHFVPRTGTDRPPPRTSGQHRLPPLVPQRADLGDQSSKHLRRQARDPPIADNHRTSHRTHPDLINDQVWVRRARGRQPCAFIRPVGSHGDFTVVFSSWWSAGWSGCRSRWAGSHGAPVVTQGGRGMRDPSADTATLAYRTLASPGKCLPDGMRRTSHGSDIRNAHRRGWVIA